MNATDNDNARRLEELELELTHLRIQQEEHNRAGYPSRADALQGAINEREAERRRRSSKPERELEVTSVTRGSHRITPPRLTVDEQQRAAYEASCSCGWSTRRADPEKAGREFRAHVVEAGAVVKPRAGGIPGDGWGPKTGPSISD